MYLCTALNEKRYKLVLGEVAEWSIAAVLKTVELRGSRGSNPCLSAEDLDNTRHKKACKSMTCRLFCVLSFFYLVKLDF